MARSEGAKLSLPKMPWCGGPDLMTNDSALCIGTLREPLSLLGRLKCAAFLVA